MKGFDVGQDTGNNFYGLLILKFFFCNFRFMVIISLILVVFITFLVKLGSYYGRVSIIFLREVFLFF